MSDLLFYAISCLILNICKHFLALFKLICNAVFCSSPALRSIISLVQGFCFCDNVFQWCGICITCRFRNILSCCLEFYNVILVSKGMNSKDPVTSSVSSFRKLASSRFCKTKLDTHHFMHPVISCKFCSIVCKSVCISGIISIICPLNRLHMCTKIAIVSSQVNSQELTIRTISRFYSCCNSVCHFQLCIFDTRLSSVLSCSDYKASVFSFCNFFQTICICSYICNGFIGFQFFLAITADQLSAIFYNCMAFCKSSKVSSLNLNRYIFQASYGISGYIVPVKYF